MTKKEKPFPSMRLKKYLLARWHNKENDKGEG